MMSRVYSYVGFALDRHEDFDSPRVAIAGTGDALRAVERTLATKRAGSIVFTYIVDAKGSLWIADRHSEHVACARGGDVLSAGEMTFEVDGGAVLVIDVTNQSTGYCPEPESWLAVAAALDRAGVPHPDGFTRAFLFRLCEGCGQTNIVKEDEFTCAVCGAELGSEWNFSNDTKERTRE